MRHLASKSGHDVGGLAEDGPVRQPGAALASCARKASVLRPSPRVCPSGRACAPRWGDDRAMKAQRGRGRASA